MSVPSLPDVRSRCLDGCGVSARLESLPKMVENNSSFTARPMTAALAFYRRGQQPFRFLDIACGDASASAGALGGTQIAHYRGMILGRGTPTGWQVPKELACPVVLEERDFLDDRGGKR